MALPLESCPACQPRPPPAVQPPQDQLPLTLRPSQQAAPPPGPQAPWCSRGGRGRGRWLLAGLTQGCYVERGHRSRRGGWSLAGHVPPGSDQLGLQPTLLLRDLGPGRGVERSPTPTSRGWGGGAFPAAAAADRAPGSQRVGSGAHSGCSDPQRDRLPGVRARRSCLAADPGRLHAAPPHGHLPAPWWHLSTAWRQEQALTLCPDWSPPVFLSPSPHPGALHPRTPRSPSNKSHNLPDHGHVCVLSGPQSAHARASDTRCLRGPARGPRHAACQGPSPGPGPSAGHSHLARVSRPLGDTEVHSVPTGRCPALVLCGACLPVAASFRDQLAPTCLEGWPVPGEAWAPARLARGGG